MVSSRECKDRSMEVGGGEYSSDDRLRFRDSRGGFIAGLDTLEGDPTWLGRWERRCDCNRGDWSITKLDSKLNTKQKGEGYQ